MTIDAAKEMIRRHVLLKAEIVEELRRSRLKSHHSPDPLQITQRIESRVSSASNDEFFNTISPLRTPDDGAEHFTRRRSRRLPA
ncbi:hypothetical protein [Sinorhizobium meliloti]|uniref:hypothetical protein n=1 Tax=Rhizobium meliloti TaxID=382 RepID=UPI0019172BE9|nr:hypothetical protein [Sinorhizobium meliloti]